ncbi:MAG TPA: ATP-binding protein [Steroidobacteraceae bacterium]
MNSSGSRDGIIVTDESGQVTFVSRSAELLIGRGAQTCLARPLAEVLTGAARLNGSAARDSFTRVLDGEAAAELTDSHPLLRADGSSITLDVTSTPMHRADGTLAGVVVSLRETAAPTAAGMPSDQERGQDDFFAILAHELRNPLAPIRNALQIMQVVQDDGATTAAARVIIERQLKHLTRLIDDLLDMSRLTQGTFELSKERTALSNVIHLALDIARPQLEGKQHPMQIELPAEEIYLTADTNRLAQTIANLLHNASKYSSTGSPIHITACGTPEEIIVRVIDQGVGIPADMFEHVFDPYGQVDRLEDGTHDGFGIGLTLVKRIIELHGGTATATSAGRGRGSEFILHLPRDHDAGFNEAPPLSSPSAEIQKLRILVADDNRDAAHTLAMLLRLDGHEVRAVHDGVEALAAGDSFEPQLVLLDIGMPLLDGYETARQIQQRPWGKQAHLVALTGWGLEADRRRAIAAGFHDHLVKPAEPEALRAVIERVAAD